MSKISKSVAIIGEGETEWFYFESLRIAQRYPFKVAPDFPSHADIGHILKLAENYIAQQYDYVICLIDMDRLLQVPAEMAKYLREKKKRAYKKVMFIETSPCTEYWFLLHFLPTLSTKRYISYDELLPELQKYMPGYEKTKRYFRRTDLYKYLRENGSLEKAIDNSQKLCEMSKLYPEDKLCYSEIHKVITLLDEIMPRR